MKEFRLDSPASTLSFGRRIGASVAGGTVIALRGGLGAGKTVLAKGIALGLGIEDEVTSPTYTIISEYEGRLRLHHMDAYRLGGPEDFEAIGGGDLLDDRRGLTVIEWSERLEGCLPDDAVTIELVVLEEGARLARLSGPFDVEWIP